MDFGIISLGNHAINRVIPAIIKEGSSIKMIHTRDRARGEKFANELGAVFFGDLDRAVKSDYDASYISSPNFLHFTHSMKSMKAGKDVLLEKPMTLSIGESEELSRYSSKEGIKMKMGFHLRFHPAIDDVREYLSESAIGEPRIAFGNWSHASSHSSSESWWGKPEMVGGGSIVGTGVHVMDSFVNLFGGEIESVSAVNNPKCAVIESTMQVRILFQNGIIANALSSREIGEAGNDLQILGREGSITVRGFYNTNVEASLFLNGDLKKKYPPLVDMYRGEIRSFVAGDGRIASAEDGVISTKLHLLSQKSACEGATIKID